MAKAKKVLKPRARVALALEPALRKEVEVVCGKLDMTLSNLIRNLLKGVVEHRIKLTRPAEVNDAVNEYYE